MIGETFINQMTCTQPTNDMPAVPPSTFTGGFADAWGYTRGAHPPANFFWGWGNAVGETPQNYYGYYGIWT